MITTEQFELIQHRFWSKVQSDGSVNGCWEWNGAKVPRGYGKLNIDGKTLYAHRIVWEASNGPIPDGKFVLHKCDNPSCVRLSHLFIGTHEDNMNDMYSKSRESLPPVMRGAKNPRAKLTRDDIQEIFRMRNIGLYQYEIADIYGVCKSQIGRVLRRETWAHIEVDENAI